MCRATRQTALRECTVCVFPSQGSTGPPSPGRQTHLDEDLGPVLVLLVRGHEEVTGQHGHQAVPLGLEVDGGIPPQEAAQSLQGTVHVAGEARERDSDTGRRTIRLCLSLPRTEEGDAQPSPR